MRSASRWVAWRTVVSLIACLSVFAVPRATNAQTAAAITGTITDAQGGVLPGVALTLLNTETGIVRSEQSEAVGTYRFAGVPPGRYDLRAELDGFSTVEVKNQVLTAGLEVKHDIKLTIRSLQEAVTVTAAVPPIIEISRSDVSSVVTQQQIESVPVPTRQTLDLALLVPGTNTDGSVPRRVSVSVGAGSAVSQNAFLVDGVSNQQSTGGDPRQDFPQGGIREFRVNVSQANAEFGGTTGGVVSIVTKSGTNQFSGEAFEFFRDTSLNAMNKFEQANHDTTGAAKPDFRQNQVGFTIGGPIVLSKVHFLLATDATKTDQSIIVNTGKPQNYSAVEGAFPNNQYRRLFFGRVDAQLSDKQTLFTRWGWERDNLTCQSCGGTAASTAGSLVQQRRNSLVLGHDWVASNHSLNEFRFQWAPFAYLNNPSEASTVWTEVGDFSPARFAQMSSVYVFPSLTYGTTANKVQIETWWEFRDDFSISTSGGKHNWKMGVASVRAPNTEDLTGNPLGTWTFSTDQLFDPGNPATVAALKAPTQFTASMPPVVHDLETNLFQTYVQDAWRPLPNLTLNLGVRYDLEYHSFNQGMDLSVFPKALPFINPTTRGDRNNVQPRIGFAWDLDKTGGAVVRGAYGLYNGTVRNGSFGTELANLLQNNITIRNPTYPDPYGGKDPLTFASTAPPNITIIRDDIRNPLAQAANIGYSQQLGKLLAVQVDGVYTKGEAHAVSVNVNTPDPATGLRPLPAWGRIVQVSPIAEAKYRALFVRLDKPFSGRTQMTVSYTLAKAEDNLASLDFYNRAADFGPANLDRRHTLVASGSMLLPFSVTVAGSWTLRSAMPFNAVAGKDLNNDGSVTDLVPGTSRNTGNRDLDLALVNAWRAQNGLAAIASSQIDSNRYNSLDIRATRTFRLQGSRKVDVIAQVFNALGADNLLASGGLGSYVSNALSDSFGKILAAGNRQQGEVAVRFAW